MGAVGIYDRKLKYLFYLLSNISSGKDIFQNSLAKIGTIICFVVKIANMLLLERHSNLNMSLVSYCRTKIIL